MQLLKDKTVVIGVTGSIAAYKIPNLVRMCKKEGADVQVLMTKNAENFINPITFESLTGNKCLIDTFDRNFRYSVEHVALAKKADIVMIAPASANVIGKIANGIADDMLTTTVMACTCKKIIAPAMNHNMYYNPIVQANLDRLRGFDYSVLSTGHGALANGDIGDGRMAEPETLFDEIIRETAFEKDLAGERILVTAGATMEPFDPVRYVTNRSTGKMGIAIAKMAALRGAAVTLVAAHTTVDIPAYIGDIRRVSTACEMYEAVTEHCGEYSVIIKAAAVADYRPKHTADDKIKKSGGDLTVEFERTPDILAALGERKQKGQFLCGFSMETRDLIENSRAKLVKKNLDMIAANNLKVEGAGFGVDTNVLTLITPDDITELPKMTKEEAANELLNKIMSRRAALNE